MILEISQGAIFGIVVGIAVVIALIAFTINRILKLKIKKNDKPTEEEIVAEEINRVLKPIDDDQTAKAVNEYKEEDE
ncbi:MAG: hypothetical protein MJ225_00405 [Bacilli bacterium]|nr:hypothetical protein [Bacilli bacterium]